MSEKPKIHGRFEAAEEILSGNKSLEELETFRELMLQHQHMFEAKAENPEQSEVVRGFRLLVAAIEARIQLKAFLLSLGGQERN